MDTFILIISIVVALVVVVLPLIAWVLRRIAAGALRKMLKEDWTSSYLSTSINRTRSKTRRKW